MASEDRKEEKNGTASGIARPSEQKRKLDVDSALIPQFLEHFSWVDQTEIERLLRLELHEDEVDIPEKRNEDMMHLDGTETMSCTDNVTVLDQTESDVGISERTLPPAYLSGQVGDEYLSPEATQYPQNSGQEFDRTLSYRIQGADIIDQQSVHSYNMESISTSAIPYIPAAVQRPGFNSRQGASHSNFPTLAQKCYSYPRLLSKPEDQRNDEVCIPHTF